MSRLLPEGALNDIVEESPPLWPDAEVVTEDSNTDISNNK